MNSRLLDTDVVDFLVQNEQKSVTDLILKGSPFKDVTPQELAQQLVGRQKSKKKLPTWYASAEVIYPPNLHIEQTSSEFTAAYKSQLVSGNLLVDSTGGFGVDSVYFAKQIKQVIHCDLNKNLQEIAHHNFRVLGCKNINSHNANGIQTALQTSSLDWLYIDPSRRNDTKGKVFFLKDCLPNVPSIQEECLEKVRNILIKTAPILDISVGMAELKNVKEIHIVGVKNEVKELLWVLEKGYNAEPKIIAANITAQQTECIQLQLNTEKKACCTLNDVSNYLYEPFASVMKTGAFNWLSEHYQVNKLHVNSHLYTSENKSYFPGKVFKVQQVLTYNKKELKQFIGEKVNVVTRNFKLSVAQLRKKYKLKEGEERFLFFTTNLHNQQIVIDCKKVTLNVV